MSTFRHESVVRRDSKTHTHTSSHSTRAVNHLQAGLEKLTEQQERLEEAREEVLIGRETLSECRLSLRQQRTRTVNAEVALMNAFRQHYNADGDRIPDELVFAYTTVDEERNRLGELEDEYLHAEDEQGTLEWTLTELETELYQSGIWQLLDDFSRENLTISAAEASPSTTKPSQIIPPSAAVEYEVASKELDQLAGKFLDLRQHISDKLISATELSLTDADSLDLDAEGYVHTFLDLLDQLCSYKVRVQQLKSQLADQGVEFTGSNRRFSEPAPQVADREMYNISPRARSEGSTDHLEDAWFSAQQVRDWLLGCLRDNALQRIQYLDVLHHTLDCMNTLLPDITQWEMLATKHWAFDMTDQIHQSIAAVSSRSQRTSSRLGAADEDVCGWFATSDITTPHVTYDSTLLSGLDSQLTRWTEKSSSNLKLLDKDPQGNESVDFITERTHWTGANSVSSDQSLGLDTGVRFQHRTCLSSGISQVQSTDHYMARHDSAQNSLFGEPVPPPPSWKNRINHTDRQSLFGNEPTRCSKPVAPSNIDKALPTEPSYSVWLWSPELHCHVGYKFGPNDAIIEVLWVTSKLKLEGGVPNGSDFSNCLVPDDL